MVWILAPNHPSLGSSKYYFTSPGTYKVGRKDCDVIIQTDKTVSRFHAEIKIDVLKPKNEPLDITNLPKPRIILKDLSKFGSFVNRNAGSKPVFSLPNKEIDLNEGDLVTFGTDSSSFRLEYFSLLPHVAPLADESKRDTIVSTVSCVGGNAVDKWCAGYCTHLIVEDGSNVTEAVIQAVADKKPVIGMAWIEAISARTSLSSEFPGFSRFTPNLLWKIDGDAKFLKIIEPEARSSAFKGFTFHVGSMYLYNHKDLLQPLAEASGGIVCPVTEVSRSRVARNPQQKPNEILIIPALEPNLQRWMSPEELRSISHVRKISEDKFIAAVLAGEFKEEYFENLASPAASAASDETVEASYSGSHEEEIKSFFQVTGQSSFVGKETKLVVSSREKCRPTSIQSTVDKTPQVKASLRQQDGSSVGFLRFSAKHKHEPGLVVQPAPTSVEKFKGVQKTSVSTSTSHSRAVSESVSVADARDSGRIILEDLGDVKADVEFRNDLVVRTSAESLEKDCSTDLSVTNFKRFRKKPGSSGNSFAALVPFAKEPYRESDFNKEVQEYMQQEKKRKEAEALAEDLFNAEKLKRQKGVGASLVSAVRQGRVKVT
eukprot:c15761_g1_i1 orf=361-2163(-)